MLACSVSFLNGPGYDWHDLLTEWTALLTWHYGLSRSFAKSFRSGLISGGGRSTQPLASQNPYHIVVCSMANYEPHLSHLWINERGNFSSGIFLFFNPYGIFLPPKILKRCDPILETIENRTLIWSIQAWECGPIHRDIPISLWLRSPPLPTIPGLRIPLKPS